MEWRKLSKTIEFNEIVCFFSAQFPADQQRQSREKRDVIQPLSESALKVVYNSRLVLANGRQRRAVCISHATRQKVVILAKEVCVRNVSGRFYEHFPLDI